MRIQHYRILKLRKTVSDFKDGFYDEVTPVTQSLETFITYLDLLTQWNEEAKPWEQAVLLATKVHSKAMAYLMNTMQRIEKEDVSELFEIIEQENDRLRKKVRELDLCDRDRIARIEELLAQLKELQSKYDKLVNEAQETYEDLRRSEERADNLDDELSKVNSDLEDANSDLEDARKRIESLEQDLEETRAELSEAQDRIERGQY